MELFYSPSVFRYICNFRRSVLNSAPRFLLHFYFSFFPPPCSPFPPLSNNVFTHRTSLSSPAKAARLADKATGFASRQGQELSALAFASGARVQGRERQVATLFVWPRDSSTYNTSASSTSMFPLNFPFKLSCHAYSAPACSDAAKRSPALTFSESFRTEKKKKSQVSFT